MRDPLRMTVCPLVLVLMIVLGSSLVLPQVGGPGLVDFRMAPLEQAKKISAKLKERNGAGEVLTVMIPAPENGRHLILTEQSATPGNIRAQLTGGGFDSVSWHRRGDPRPDPDGACDSQEECQDETDQMCSDAGHEGVDGETVTVTVHADGSSTCSGDCIENGAVAFVTCSG